MRLHFKKSFSFVEFLVAVSTLILLSSLLVPSLKTLSYNAQNSACMKNLQQIYMAQFAFMGDRNERFHAIDTPRALLENMYFPNGYQGAESKRGYYHEDKAGYLVPYLGKPKVANSGDDVYNCPSYLHNPESKFYLEMKSNASTYTGFGPRFTPLTTDKSYAIGQRNVGNPGPGFIAEIYNKPITWDYKKMRSGWNSTLGSVIHQNTGELPVAFLDGQVKLCFFPITMWELPAYKEELEEHYRAWYN